MMKIEVLVYEIVQFTLGIFGNIIGIITFLKSKKLVNIGTRRIYIYLLIVDTLFLLQMLSDSISIIFEYNITSNSLIACRLYHYLTRVLSTLSPMLLVYISIERYLSFGGPTKKLSLRKSKNQNLYLFIIIIFNLFYYTPCLIYFETTLDLLSNQTICDLNDESSETILSIMDLTNRVAVPCVLMAFATVLLILSIFESKNRVLMNYSSKFSTLLQKYIKLAITSICLNIIYIVLSLPLPILFSFMRSYTDSVFYFVFFLFCLSYSLNFYILFITNSLFRAEFFKVFKFKSKPIFV